MKPPAVLLAVSAVLAVTACGTTVDVPAGQQAQQTLNSGGLSVESPAPQSSQPGVVVPGSTTPVGTSSGAAPVGANGTTTPVGTSPGSTRTHVIETSSGQRVTVGPGITATTVKIGVPYLSNAGAADEATGSEGIDPGDTRHEFEALWDDVNKHGGLGGRKAVLDFYEIPATTPDAEQAANAACEHFTKDEHDFAVINPGPQSYRTCLEKNGVFHIASDLTVSSEADVTKLPHNIQPAGITMEDSARTLVQGLNAMGYFNNAKVGILSFDDPAFVHAVNTVMKPAMQAIGHPAADTVLVHSPNSVAEYGTMSQDCTNAAVRFRTEGITHVILFDANGRLATFFPTAARAQHAHFNYGITSQSGMQVGLDSGNVDPDQVVGSMGVGWLPLFDVAHKYQPKNPLAKKCLDFFARKGFPADNSNAAVIQEFMCQDAWTMQRIMGALTNVITRDTALQAAEALGNTVPNVANYSTRLDARHHDGVGSVQLYYYDDKGCRCYRPHAGTPPKV